MKDKNIIIPDAFYHPEDRNGYHISETRKKTWAILLEMLSQLDYVCKKHNLVYYVDSGTLLGAVRDKGFIPWDDDIDVIMMRADYNKLVRNYSQEFAYPYFLQSAYSEKNYFRTHAQLRHSLSTAMLPNEALLVGFNQGIFLDIFPVDHVRKNEKKRISRFNHIRKWQKAFIEKMFGPENVGPEEREIRNKYLKHIERLGDKRAYRLFEFICGRSFGRYLDKVSYYTDLKKYRVFPSDFFGKPVYLDFEFTQVPAPQKFDEVLKRYYGENYMTPIESKSGHQLNGNLIIDPDIPYYEKIKEMRS